MKSYERVLGIVTACQVLIEEGLGKKSPEDITESIARSLVRQRKSKSKEVS